MEELRQKFKDSPDEASKFIVEIAFEFYNAYRVFKQVTKKRVISKEQVKRIAVVAAENYVKKMMGGTKKDK